MKSAGTNHKAKPSAPRSAVRVVSRVFICLAEPLFIGMKVVSVLVAAICISILGISAGADAATRQPTNITEQELGSALQTLARERDVQIVYRSEFVGEHRTGGAKGNLTFEEALTQLLHGTGLTFRYLAEKAITIVPIDDPTPPGAP